MSTRTPPSPRAKTREVKDAEPLLIAENRKALHDYHVLETFEAGVQRGLGTEVKGIREGKANLRDSYARVEKGEVWLYNVHINPYSHRGYVDHDPRRRRKLLLHKLRDPQARSGKTTEKGLTLVPLRMYFLRGRVKVALSLVQRQTAARQARDHPEA